MRLAALFSGGKDSTYAIYYAVNQGWEIRYLITAIPKREYESFMWHYPTIKWTKVQADAMGIKQLQVEVSSRDEMKEIVEVLSELKKKEEIEGLISGVIASDYQKNRLDMLCEDLNLKLIAPLWQKDPLMLLNEIINSNFRVIVVSASAYGFTKEWLGKELNKRTVAELKELHRKYKIHPCGEGGEFETFVYDCPLFHKKLEIVDYEIVWYRYSGALIIKKIAMHKKHGNQA